MIATAGKKMNKNEATVKFWKNYLIMIGVSLIGMGLYVAFFNNTPLFKLFGNLIDPVFYPNETVPKEHEISKASSIVFPVPMFCFGESTLFFFPNTPLFRAINGHGIAWPCQHYSGSPLWFHSLCITRSTITWLGI